MNELAAKYPNLISVSSAGSSYEGNRMNLVKISTGGTGKKAIFVDGGIRIKLIFKSVLFNQMYLIEMEGIHAREWISPAYVTWMIRELVENYAAHPQYVDNIDWYIMPVINPDGYRYTFAANGVRFEIQFKSFKRY